MSIVSTIPDRCKRCYSCIRECPAKAIKVINGQAVVIAERCIACGHCFKVCSQHAKKLQTDVELVSQLLIENKNVIAIVDSSFSASFPDNYNKVPEALRKLGFKAAIDSSFGVDLISTYYKDLINEENSNTIISSSCPAVVGYIEKYFVELIPHLANIDSPMIALAKYLKADLSDSLKIVFIGPCISKKKEAAEIGSGLIDAVLTFYEIKKMLVNKNIILDSLEYSEFDRPHSYLGKVYPLPGGLLRAAEISSDLVEKKIIVVDGKQKVIEVIDELSNNNINAKFVDVHFCEGCISGPAIDSKLNYYSRRESLLNYIEEKSHTVDKQVWKSKIFNSRNIDFGCEFKNDNQRKEYPTEERIVELLAETNKHSSKDILNCGACGYETCREFAVAIHKEFAEKEMCLPYLIDKLGSAYDDLKNTQEQLHAAEKLASIGQLAAGVAHEINNPLGTILLYSSMLKQEAKNFSDPQFSEDLAIIIEETNRCKNIVANLLNFARQGKLNVSKVNICQLLVKIIRSIRINPKFKDVVIIPEKRVSDCFIDGDEDQLKQVFLNIMVNACEAMDESVNKVITIKKYFEEDELVVEISDTGSGISRENVSKIFTPFFTTKKIGNGTGLGLAISYGIIKMHKGHINFTSEEGKGTVFTVRLPKNSNF